MLSIISTLFYRTLNSTHCMSLIPIMSSQHILSTSADKVLVPKYENCHRNCEPCPDKVQQFVIDHGDLFGPMERWAVEQTKWCMSGGDGEGKKFGDGKENHHRLPKLLGGCDDAAGNFTACSPIDHILFHFALAILFNDWILHYIFCSMVCDANISYEDLFDGLGTPHRAHTALCNAVVDGTDGMDVFVIVYFEFPTGIICSNKGFNHNVAATKEFVLTKRALGTVMGA